MGRKTSRKTTDQKTSEAVIGLQAKLDKAEAEVKGLSKTINLMANTLRLMALCLGDKDE